MRTSRNKETSDSSQSLAAQLSARGVRLTSQRKQLLELLESSSGHLDVPLIVERAREKGISVDRATVYRTLLLLKKHKLVNELDLLHLGGGGHYYELSDAGEHVHIGCTRCGQILEHETALLGKLRSELARRGFRVESIRTEVAVLCPKCQH